MSFNFRLAKEIYGMTPWFVDAGTLPVLTSLLKDFRSGVSFSEKESKCNQVTVLNPKNLTILDSYSSWKLKDTGRIDEKEEVIMVINLDGAITKNGGMSSFGTVELANIMRSTSKDDRVKGFIILADSGGGSSAAVELMVNAINEVKQTKPVHALIDEGGMAASACYGIISAAHKIWASDKMSIVGSAGTMINFEGRKANKESPDGTKEIRLYASKSVRKNEGFEAALNDSDYSLLIDNLLDPINENFLNMITKNRPVLKGTDFDTGKTVFAKDAIGTFIDGIKPLDQVVKLVLSESKEMKNKSNNNSKTTSKMNAEQLKNEYPGVYNEIFNAGVTKGVAQEKDRAGAWLAHASSDIEGVKKGIQSGNDISATEREEFLVKAASKKTVENLEKDSAQPVNTPESGSEKKEETEVEAFYKRVGEKL